MNTVATFRKCTLTDQELIDKVDKMTDAIYSIGGDHFPNVLIRHIPAQVNDDYDLIVGELIIRFKERCKL